jgi:hypothetical protein
MNPILFYPQTAEQVRIFREFAEKFNWHYDSRQNLWDKYITCSPKNVNLSDDEIAEMVRAERYEKVKNNH